MLPGIVRRFVKVGEGNRVNVLCEQFRKFYMVFVFLCLDDGIQSPVMVVNGVTHFKSL